MVLEFWLLVGAALWGVCALALEDTDVLVSFFRLVGRVPEVGATLSLSPKVRVLTVVTAFFGGFVGPSQGVLIRPVQLSLL